MPNDAAPGKDPARLRAGSAASGFYRHLTVPGHAVRHGQLNRRQALAAAGTAGLGGLLAACGGDGDGAPAARTAEPTRSPSNAAAGRFDESASCSLTAEETEGPYYFDVDAIRDIREDREGTPLRLALRIRDAGSCEPLRSAVVDIWHCDARGSYSGFEAATPGGGRTDEETYLRGAQATDADGIVEFHTVYPGFYPGRTVHIHAKVHLDRRTVLTTQLYFDDAFTDRIHARRPYSRAGRRDTSNDTDGLFDESLLLTLSEEDDGVLGLMTFDVRRA